MVSGAMVWRQFGHPTVWYYGISVSISEIIDFRHQRYGYLDGAERGPCSESVIDSLFPLKGKLSIRQIRIIDSKGLRQTASWEDARVSGFTRGTNLISRYHDSPVWWLESWIMVYRAMEIGHPTACHYGILGPVARIIGLGFRKY